VFRNEDELKHYVIQNYPEVTDNRMDGSHWDLMCTRCNLVSGFQVIKRGIAMQPTPYNRQGERDYAAPTTYYFRCPVCAGYKIWLVFELSLVHEDDQHYHYYRAPSLPSEGLENFHELPDDPPALRTAYRQAIRATDANAASMFRRAVQVITRNILGAKPGNLANELNAVAGHSYNGVTITTNFASVGYIVKEAGNQGAHPDQDPDLLDFTAQDAEDLQRIFMELVSELFIVPEATKKAKAEFLASKTKNNPSSSEALIDAFDDR
jgi:hypothetical protein